MKNFDKFLAVRDIRHYLNTPFHIKGVGTIACNGWAGVVKPAIVDTTPNLPPKFPEMFRDWFDKLPPPQDGLDMKVITLPELLPCGYCDGTGTAHAKKVCPECAGAGSFEHGNYTYDCKECKGDGEIDDPIAEPETCGKCNGTCEAFHKIGVGGMWFSAAWIRLFSEFPNAVIHVGGHTGTTSDKAYITFDGGWGVLMPCRE